MHLHSSFNIYTYCLDNHTNRSANIPRYANHLSHLTLQITVWISIYSSRKGVKALTSPRYLCVDMPDLVTSMVHIANLELYKTEKPFVVINSIQDRNHDEATNNLVFETHEDILIRDIRGHEGEFTLECSGFVVEKTVSILIKVETWTDIRRYQKETEDFLTRYFQADAVHCYDLKVK